jgi:hypothetical protein
MSLYNSLSTHTHSCITFLPTLAGSRCSLLPRLERPWKGPPVVSFFRVIMQMQCKKLATIKILNKLKWIQEQSGHLTIVAVNRWEKGVEKCNHSHSSHDHRLTIQWTKSKVYNVVMFLQCKCKPNKKWGKTSLHVRLWQSKRNKASTIHIK